MASTKQQHFANQLFAKLGENANPAIEAALAPIQDDLAKLLGDAEACDGRTASRVIDALVAAQRLIVVALTPEQDAAIAWGRTQVSNSFIINLVSSFDDRRSLSERQWDCLIRSHRESLTAPDHGAARSIATKRSGKCAVCAAPTGPGNGFALLDAADLGRGWKAVCPAHHAREARKAAKVEAQADAAAQPSLRELTAIILDGADRQDLRFAIPSGGDNDLDFLRVKDGRVLRVIGGRADQPLAAAQAITLAQRLVDLGADGRDSAQRLFGQELGMCGRCGRHLTDEVSRSIGLGPDCAAR